MGQGDGIDGMIQCNGSGHQAQHENQARRGAAGLRPRKAWGLPQASCPSRRPIPVSGPPAGGRRAPSGAAGTARDIAEIRPGAWLRSEARLQATAAGGGGAGGERRPPQGSGLFQLSPRAFKAASRGRRSCRRAVFCRCRDLRPGKIPAAALRACLRVRPVCPASPLLRLPLPSRLSRVSCPFQAVLTLTAFSGGFFDFREFFGFAAFAANSASQRQDVMATSRSL
jgi:hypothetical protein